MPVNWKDPKAFERLLAAMVAAQEMNLDYRKIASMYGEGATYDAIEGRFRIIRKEAQKLLAEIESGERPAAPPRGAITESSSTISRDEVTTLKKPRKPRSTNATPRAKKFVGGEKALGGRVTKTTGSITKKKALTGIGNSVKEAAPSAESSMDEFDEFLNMDMDGESVAEGLGLDAASPGYGFGMEI